MSLIGVRSMKIALPVVVAESKPSGGYSAIGFGIPVLDRG